MVLPPPVPRAKEIKAIYASFKTDRDASIEKIHHFVKSIPQLTQKYRGLNLYINIAELLKPTTDSVRFRHQWQVRSHVLEPNQSLDLPSRRLLKYTMRVAHACLSLCRVPPQVERSMVEGDAQYDYLEDMIAGYEPVTQVCFPYNCLKMAKPISSSAMQTRVDSSELTTLPYLPHSLTVSVFRGVA